MENAEQFSNYKLLYKKNAGVRVGMDVIIITAFFLIFFLPCFRVGLSEAEPGNPFGIGSFNFSLCDEVIHFFSSHPLMVDEDYERLIMFLLACAFAIGEIAIAIVDLVKSGLRCNEPEHYAMKEYERAQANEEKKKALLQFSPVPLFFCAVGYILLTVGFLKLIWDMEFSFFSFMNGIAWGLVIVLIFVVAVIVLASITANMGKKLKAQIVQETADKPQPKDNKQSDRK